MFCRYCRRKSKPKLLWSPKTTGLKTLFLPEWQIAQRERSVEEETDDGPAVRRNAAEEDDEYHLQFSHLRYLRPRTDVLRFNRAQVMEKIVESIDLSRPVHRHGKHLDEWCVFMHILPWLWHRIGQKVWDDYAFSTYITFSSAWFQCFLLFVDFIITDRTRLRWKTKI